MEQDKFTNIIQAMPFVEGKIGITSGTVPNVTLIHCNEDGNLTLIFPGGGTEDVAMVAGADRSIKRGSSVTVVNDGGSFDFD